MGYYQTLDYLSPYMPTATQMGRAQALSFSAYTPSIPLMAIYDHEAEYYESGDYASLRDLFRVNFIEGATYYIYSSSYFDPFLLSVHDNQGRFIAVDNGTTYGSDSIYNFIAPYTGTYYVNASWDQGFADSHKFVYLSILEDIGTATPADSTPPTVTVFSPADESTGVVITGNIVVTFSEAIQRGTGSILLKNATGTTIETFDAASSSQLLISGSTLTIDPTNALANDTNYYVTFTSGTIKDLAGNAYAGTTSYDFTTVASAPAIGTAGNDTIYGGAFNELMDGGAGIDTAIFSGNHSDYTITKTAAGFTLNGEGIGTNTLCNIERIQFADCHLALDLDGNAGNAAKILGAVFGSVSVSNKIYAGIVLGLLDGGMSYEDLAGLAITAAGASTPQQVVELLWTNVVGSAPTAGQVQPFVDMLNGGITTGQFGVLVAGTTLNQQNINLVGLTQTGLEFA